MADLDRHSRSVREARADLGLADRMRLDLGRQLAALRREAGLTQASLAALAGFARSTVSLAETGRPQHAREFWQACDKALRTGSSLTAGFEQIEAVRVAQDRAAAHAAEQAREARALDAFQHARQSAIADAASVQACPHCGKAVLVLTTLAAQPAEPVSEGATLSTGGAGNLL